MIGAITGIGGVYHSSALFRVNLNTRQPLGTERAIVGQTPESGRTVRVGTARRAQPEVPVQPVETVKPVRDDTFNKDALLHFMANDPVEGAVRSRIRYMDNGVGPEESEKTDNRMLPGLTEQRKEDDDGVPTLPGQEKAGEQFPGEVGNTRETGAKEDEPKVSETPTAQEVAEEGECQTCKNRKYQDGSDDPGVSFKMATGVDPKLAQAAVRGHENEHVVRERAKAIQEDRKVVSQSVSYRSAICPECGKVYIAGGTTRTVTVNKPEPYSPQDEEEKEESPFSMLA